MSDDSPVTPEQHRALAVSAFNQAWTLMETPDRTPDQDDELVHTAHASRHHWGIVGTPVHRARGEWQVSRVYALLGRAEPSRYHAQRCLDLCQEHGIGDWDLAFAYEALARAASVAGDAGLVASYREKALTASEVIADPDDRKVVLDDLAGIPE
ncbi:MAG: hypothetical protein WAN48_15810 [Actinomycetes bacterium]